MLPNLLIFYNLNNILLFNLHYINFKWRFIAKERCLCKLQSFFIYWIVYITRLSWGEGPKHLWTYYNWWYFVLFTAPVLGSVFDLFIKSPLTHIQTHNSLWNNMAFFQWLWYQRISHLIEAYENAAVTNNILQWICICFVLRIETGPHNHSAKVSESMLSTNDEEWLVKVWMIFTEFLLLDFSGEKTFWA